VLERAHDAATRQAQMRRLIENFQGNHKPKTSALATGSICAGANLTHVSGGEISSKKNGDKLLRHTHILPSLSNVETNSKYIMRPQKSTPSKKKQSHDWL